MIQRTVDDWLAAEKGRLDEFAHWWKHNQPIKPEEFPATMPLGEWDEQYRCWGGG